MQIYGKTDKGPVRRNNQDAFVTGTLPDGAIYTAVCDGMGGANGGNIASTAAARCISEYIRNSYRPNMDDFDIEKMLKNGISSANIEIYDLSLKREDLKGMGTTVVAAVVRDGNAIIAHVGDSRAYLISQDMSQLTRDHSVVQGLVESGKITPQDAKVHPRKNVITRALGVEDHVLVDCNEYPVVAGNTLLLCTDGLTGYADENEIFETIRNTAAQNLPDALISLAIAGGGGDNITAVIVEV